jgi:hypothetical protein
MIGTLDLDDIAHLQCGRIDGTGKTNVVLNNKKAGGQVNPRHESAYFLP